MTDYKEFSIISIPGMLWRKNDDNYLYERVFSWEKSLDEHFKDPIATEDINRDSVLVLEDKIPEAFLWRELLGSRLMMLDIGLLRHSMKPITRGRMLPAICMAFAFWGETLLGFGESMEPYFVPLDEPHEDLVRCFTGLSGEGCKRDNGFYACLETLSKQQRDCIAEFIEIYHGIFLSTTGSWYTEKHAQAAKKLAEIWRNG